MGGHLHLSGARIWTGDASRPWATSLTIRDGRVVAIDQPAPGVPSIDAAGRHAAPGLIDAHTHLLLGGRSLAALDLSEVRSREAFEGAIARRHESLTPDEWLIAHGWSSENWPSGELPTKAWLARAGDRPVVCHRMDLHAALVNDAVLSLCDLAAELPGGRVERDPRTGEPTGLMLEAAAWRLVNPIVPRPSATEQRVELLRAQSRCHEHGLTTVGTMEYARDVSNVYEPLRDALTLRCRVTLLDRGWPLDTSFGRLFANDDRLAVIGYKAFIDGTLGSRTARMLREYADDPGNRGELIELAASGDLFAWARTVGAAGLSPSMHAIGDEAVRLALDVAHHVGLACRPRIEHAQQIDPSDLHRFQGVTASMQPLHKADDGRYLSARVGPERVGGAFPFRSLLDRGAHLAFGSDWPVVSCDPLAGIRTAVTGMTREGTALAAEQNLTVDEALRAYTSGAASALAMEGEGVLRPGASGDLVLFDRDPFAADWACTPPAIVLTVSRGRVVYDGASIAPHQRDAPAHASSAGG